MKKYLLILMSFVLAMTACTKSDNYAFDGNQWITDEFPADSEWGFAHKMLYDAGVYKSGQLSMAIVVCEDAGSYVAGDVLSVVSVPYNYDAVAKKITIGDGGSTASVKFLSADSIVITSDDEESVSYVFSKVSKKYNLKTAIDLGEGGSDDEDEEFSISASMSSEWAGGEIRFTANREVSKWSHKSIPPKVAYSLYGCSPYPSKIENGVFTVGWYYYTTQKGNETRMFDCSVEVTAESVDGEVARDTVVAKAWDIVFADSETNPVAFLDPETISGLMEFGVGVVDARGDVYKNFTSDERFGLTQNCMYFFGSRSGLMCGNFKKKSAMDTSKGEVSPYYVGITYGGLTRKVTFPDANIPD